MVSISIDNIIGYFSNYFTNENFPFLFLLLLVILFLYTFSQMSRYNKLKKWLKKNLEETERQKEMIKWIEDEIEKCKKAQEGLDYWSNIKEELVELSKLPSLQEDEKEFILRIQISKLKKDKIDVIADKNAININLYEGETPLKATYHMPKPIDPNRLLISYKDNTLEVRAEKI
ncbi:MAG: Hsp20/alpha crystallin family protein [Candidatus Altiarchaeota archaeon]